MALGIASTRFHGIFAPSQKCAPKTNDIPSVKQAHVSEASVKQAPLDTIKGYYLSGVSFSGAPKMQPPSLKETMQKAIAETNKRETSWQNDINFFNPAQQLEYPVVDGTMYEVMAKFSTTLSDDTKVSFMKVMPAEKHKESIENIGSSYLFSFQKPGEEETTVKLTKENKVEIAALRGIIRSQVFDGSRKISI